MRILKVILFIGILILFSVSSYAAGKQWDERFEGAGTEEVWNHANLIKGTGTVDEDKNTATVVGAPSNWDFQCCEFKITADGDYAAKEHTNINWPAPGIQNSWMDFAFVVESESIDDGKSNCIGQFREGPGKPVYNLFVQNDSGTLHLYCDAYLNGTDVTRYVASIAVVINGSYIVHVIWDNKSKYFCWEVNGVLEDSANIQPGAYVFAGVKYGITNNSGDMEIMTIHMDNIFFGDRDWTRVLSEGFESEAGYGPGATKGYEYANWTETLGGTAVLDQDYADGTYIYGGDEVCRMVNNDTDTDLCYVTRTENNPIVFIRDVFKIVSTTMPEGEDIVLGWGDTGGVGKTFDYRLEKNGGKYRIKLDVLKDTSSPRYSSGDYADLQLGTWYRLEIYYNETDNEGSWRMIEANESGIGIEQSRFDLAGGGGERNFDIFYLEADSTLAEFAIEIWRDNFAIDTTYWCGPHIGLPFYVDNEDTGDDLGTQDQPYQSIANLEADSTFDDSTAPHSVYIAATDTPYREKLGTTSYWGSTIYCDWTGTGNIRGIAKALFHGSEKIEPWGIYGGGIAGTYSASMTETVPGPMTTNNEGDGGVWYIENDGTITALLRGADEDHVDLGEWYHDNAADTLYVNVGEDPDNGSIEAADRIKAMEIWGQESLYRGIFKYANYGQQNSDCSEWLITGCDFIYNAYTNFSTGAETNNWDSPDFLLTKCSVHHAGMNGIFVGHVNNSAIEGVIRSCRIFSNAGNGIDVSGGMSSSGTQFLKIFNSTIYGNTKGVYGYKTGAGADQLCKIICKNTISQANSGNEFEAENHANVTITADYNCVGGGTYDGVKWTAGAHDISTAALFKNPTNNNFHLKSTSPCINSGTDTIYSSAIYDFDERQITDDTGNAIKNMPMGIYLFSGASGAKLRMFFEIIFDSRRD